MSFFSSRSARLVAGLAVVSAFAALPVAAQAADTVAGGTLTGGALSNTAPAITPVVVTLTGVTQDVPTGVGAYNVIDATGSNDGYSVTVTATPPTVDTVAADAGTAPTLILTPTTATADAGNPAATGPVAEALPQSLSMVAATIQNAPATTGQGRWNFAADNGTTQNNLSVRIPGDASAGAYASTLTYTTAIPVGI